MNGIIDTMNTTWMDIAQKRDCDLHCTMEFVIIEAKKLKNINSEFFHSANASSAAENTQRCAVGIGGRGRARNSTGIARSSSF